MSLAGRESGIRDQSLLARIALRIAAVTFLAALLNAAFVLANYAGNDEELGQDLLGKRAAEVGGLIRPGADPVIAADDLRRFRRQAGSSEIGIAVFDAAGAPLLIDNPHKLGLPAQLISTDLQTVSSRQQRDGRFLLSGFRRLTAGGRPYWVAIAITGSGFRPFWPVLADEMDDHVLVPLLPLFILLVLSNVTVVRRTLAPLERVIAEVDALTPAAPGSRLEVPRSPSEARVLVLAINRALGRVEDAMRSLKQFTADAAHELRTPLSVLKLSLEQLPESALKEKLRRDADAMVRLVGQMLDMARADALVISEEARVDLGEVARGVVMQLTALAVRAGRRILFHDAGPPAVRGHAEALSRALRNVVENALAYSPAGTDIEVCVGPGATCAVRDHGPGIPRQDRERLFERFRRGSHGRWSAGAGLGLGIAKAIVEAHGGVVEIEDAPGGGAVVRFVLQPAAPSGEGG